MLKAPQAGRVKTRLQKDLGEAATLAAYRRLVEWQMGQLPPDWSVTVSHDPAEAGPEMQAWLGSRPRYLPQTGGTLGERLQAVVSGHFERHPGEPLMLLGGDCPYLTHERLQIANEMLQCCDVFLHPAEDGGYCLMGLKADHRGLFARIAWSTSRVLAQTLERAEVLGLHVRQNEPLEDVDHLESWRRAEAFLDGATAKSR